MNHSSPKRFWYVIAMAAAFCISACSKPASHEPQINTKPLSNKIVATSYPLQFITQSISGTQISVEFPVPDDTDPRTWQPSVDAIQDMQSADLIVAGGPGIQYAEWLEKISLPDSKIYNTNRALSLNEYIHVKDYKVIHTHGPGGEHSHPLMIPYSWMNPAIAKKQAASIAEKLTSLYPERSTTFENNLTALNAELDGLSASLAELKKKRFKILSVNPNAIFLTRAAEIDDNYLLWLEPAKDDAEEAARIKDLQTKFQEGSALKVLDSTRFANSTIAAAKLDAVEIFAINLFDHAPPSGNFLTGMRQNIETLQSAAETR